MSLAEAIVQAASDPGGNYAGVQSAVNAALYGHPGALFYAVMSPLGLSGVGDPATATTPTSRISESAIPTKSATGQPLKSCIQSVLSWGRWQSARHCNCSPPAAALLFLTGRPARHSLRARQTAIPSPCLTRPWGGDLDEQRGWCWQSGFPAVNKTTTTGGTTGNPNGLQLYSGERAKCDRINSCLELLLATRRATVSACPLGRRSINELYGQDQ